VAALFFMRTTTENYLVGLTGLFFVQEEMIEVTF